MPPLRRADLDSDPFVQFDRWWSERAASRPATRDEVALATADARGRPSLRMVLLKGHARDGFRFFTNQTSRKGRELAQNPHAALLVYDSERGRQMRVEGAVHPLEDRENDRYWATRPRGSQLSAYVSPQSRPVEDRDALERARREAEARFSDRDVPRPPHWGGYRLAPEAFEFWQHGDDRLHDRFGYGLQAGGSWRIERLGP